MANAQKKDAQEQARDWYSVQEAADYLGVSQPTIFRWMRQGTLSFYKVGSSTRFSKDGLNAIIEKTTGQREAEAVASRCAACGHSILVEGQLQGTGRLYFRPLKTRFWVLSEGLVPTRSRVCAACGYIQLHADTRKLRQLSTEVNHDAQQLPTDDTKGGN
jgi:excisionase family DNA binding protein